MENKKQLSKIEEEKENSNKINIDNNNESLPKEGNNSNINNDDSKFFYLQKFTEESIKSTVKKRRNSSLVRQLVSKDKNRFCFDGFDLDLTYITPNIIAMGKPSTSIEGIYRNKLDDVKNFFNSRHKDHYKVYNLCKELIYPENVFLLLIMKLHH